MSLSRSLGVFAVSWVMACQRPSPAGDASHRSPPAVHADAAVAVAAVDAGAVADAGPVVSRVACVTPELTELVDAMGLGDHIVGVSGLEAPGGTARPRVGPMVNPDVDVILAQRAEAVLTLDGPFSGAAASRLRAAGVAIRVLRTENLAETLAAATSIGRWLGRSDAAEAYRARVQSALAAATARTASRRERPRVLGLVMRQPIVVVEGQGTWFDDLVRASGGTVPVSSTNRHPIATPDQIAQWAPDVIVDFTDGSEADLRAMFEHPDAVPALRDPRGGAHHDRLLLQHGGQVTEALQRMQSVVR